MGCASPPPSSVVAKTKSDHAQRNANRLTVTIALRLTGRITDTKVRHFEAPSIRAALVSSCGMPDMKAVKIRTPKGTAMVESARIRPAALLSTPSRR
jgi:hypothetical protein